MRAVLAALLAVAVTAVAAVPANAEPLLSAGDAAELAQALAEATDEQGVCYGWSVRVNDQSGGPSGLETGSSGGPGTPLGANVATDCSKSVELSGYVTYTCGSCESEDSSGVSVVSSFPGGPTTGDLEDLGLKGGQLKDDDGDVALANMVGALPIITASKGLADPVEPDPQATPAATTDRPTNTPSTPDWLRESWLTLAVCVLALIGGIWWFLAAPRPARRPRPGPPAQTAPRPVPTPDEDA